jgi:hypothetical protein
MWNYGHMTKNLTGHFIYYLIDLISINSALREFQICCVMSITYIMVIRIGINGFILHSYSFHKERQLSARVR